MLDKIFQIADKKVAFAGGVGFLWLVHVSALIGITIGYDQWFLVKTPANLSLLLVLTILFFPIKDRKVLTGLILFFLGGMLAEIMGVNTGLLFGEYTYGNNLGIKFMGVPLLIGVNWAVLVLTTAQVSTKITDNLIGRAVIGAGLMVGLDMCIEPLAPKLDFWLFAGGVAPVFNYVCWFVVAFFLHLVFHKWKLTGSLTFSVHVLASQFVFFIYLYFVYCC